MNSGLGDAIATAQQQADDSAALLRAQRQDAIERTAQGIETVDDLRILAAWIGSGGITREAADEAIRLLRNAAAQEKDLDRVRATCVDELALSESELIDKIHEEDRRLENVISHELTRKQMLIKFLRARRESDRVLLQGGQAASSTRDQALRVLGLKP